MTIVHAVCGICRVSFIVISVSGHTKPTLSQLSSPRMSLLYTCRTMTTTWSTALMKRHAPRFIRLCHWLAKWKRKKRTSLSVAFRKSRIIFYDPFTFEQDDESIPMELRHTKEYRQILCLKKMRRQRLQEEKGLSVRHIGFKVGARAVLRLG
jgi:hypothetical protein